jgi:dienelactone hydrolase
MTIATRAVSYRHQETALTGLLAWDEAAQVPRPGILLVPGAAGLDDHAKAQARRYASLGHAVLACDMLGEGIAGDR